MMGWFKYIIGGIGGGLLGVGKGIAAFGTAYSGVGAGIAVGLLAVKAFSGSSRSSIEESTELIRQHLTAQPTAQKKPPRKRAVKATAKKAAPRKTAARKDAS
jgi:hypothetical protein